MNTIDGVSVVVDYVRQNNDKYVTELKDYLSIPSISTLPQHKTEVERAAQWLGSPHLDSFIEKNKEKLSCKFCLNTDSGISGPDRPSIVCGLRGLVYFEVWVRGAESDLHSGSFGGVVANPAIVLSELISGLHDKDAKVTLGGFYDKVRKLTPQERDELAKNRFSD